MGVLRMVITAKMFWDGLDRLAERRGLSASGLAKKVGLDPTAFNKSKRTNKDGSDRWMGTQTLATVCNGLGVTLEQFTAVATGGNEDETDFTLPYTTTEEYGASSTISLGAWERMSVTVGGDAYILEIADDRWGCDFPRGSLLVVSSKDEPRSGDHVVVKTQTGDLKIIELHRTTNSSVSGRLAGSDTKVNIPRLDVKSIHRILWMSC